MTGYLFYQELKMVAIICKLSYNTVTLSIIICHTPAPLEVLQTVTQLHVTQTLLSYIETHFTYIMISMTVIVILITVTLYNALRDRGREDEVSHYRIAYVSVYAL